ncbi:prefoldin subunit 5 [Rhizobium sp. BK602]|nr:prefoldin subunit 5 [Rhizobium sp. BK602]
MQISVKKPEINPAHFIAIIGGALVNAFIIGGVWVSLNRDIADLRSSQDRTQKALDATAQQVSQIAPLSFQTTRALEAGAENKKAIELTNARIDRVAESIGGKLDTAIDSINKVSTQVQVLSSKFEDNQGRPDKTLFRTPVVRP